MTICSVCQFENDDFAVTCKNCKGFLQNRIPNLDLFETTWGVIESPRAAFRKIAIAEHKNFVLLLFGLFGIGLSFTALWQFELGDRFSTLLDLIVFAIVSGPGVGVLVSVFLGIAYHVLAKIVGGKASFRTSVGAFAYSLTPILISIFLVLPIELMTFGIYMFTLNPHPYVLKPLSYTLLIGFDSLVTVWAIVLLVVGTAVVHSLRWWKALLVVLLFLALVWGAIELATQNVPRYL
ncbi:MAG: YIP1 family protein [Ignavibacteriae bacterium]|nr:YIP1 family protein [Ignavibacteriota bacterium]